MTQRIEGNLKAIALPVPFELVAAIKSALSRERSPDNPAAVWLELTRVVAFYAGPEFFEQGIFAHHGFQFLIAARLFGQAVVAALCHGFFLAPHELDLGGRGGLFDEYEQQNEVSIELFSNAQ